MTEGCNDRLMLKESKTRDGGQIGRGCISATLEAVDVICISIISLLKLLMVSLSVCRPL